MVETYGTYRTYARAGLAITLGMVMVVFAVCSGSLSAAARYTGAEFDGLPVKSLSLEGNDLVSSSQIREQIAINQLPWYHSLLFWKTYEPYLFNSRELARDSVRIELAYRDLGFFHAWVTKLEVTAEEKQVHARITISEGKRSKLRLVRFEAPELPFNRVKLQNLVRQRTGDDFVPSEVAVTVDQMVRVLQDEAFPFASVTPRIAFLEDSTQVDLFFTVNPERRVRLGNLRYVGLGSVDFSAVEQDLNLWGGHYARRKDLEDAARALYNRNVFRYVRIELDSSQVQPGDTIIPVLVTLAEDKHRSAELAGGYNTDLGLRGKLTLEERNLFGGFQTLTAEGILASYQQSVSLFLRWPNLVVRKSEIRTGASYDKQIRPGFNSRGYTLTLAPGYHVNSRLFSEVSYSRSVLDIVAKADTTGKVTGTTNINLFKMRLDYADLDNPLDPGVGNRTWIEISENGLLIPSTNRFYGFQLSTVGYLGFGRTKRATTIGTAVFRLELGAVFSGDANLVPPPYRYYAGGPGNLRGIELDRLGPEVITAKKDTIPTGGNWRLLGNIEFRIPVVWRIGLVPFFDWAALAPERVTTSSIAWGYSVGMGVTFSTPLGPIRVDLAWPLFAEAKGRRQVFNLGIGHPF